MTKPNTLQQPKAVHLVGTGQISTAQIRGPNCNYIGFHLIKALKSDGIARQRFRELIETTGATYAHPWGYDKFGRDQTAVNESMEELAPNVFVGRFEYECEGQTYEVFEACLYPNDEAFPWGKVRSWQA
jgi:hypothetical protein